MITIDYIGKGGVPKIPKSDYVILEQPLTLIKCYWSVIWVLQGTSLLFSRHFQVHSRLFTHTFQMLSQYLSWSSTFSLLVQYLLSTIPVISYFLSNFHNLSCHLPSIFPWFSRNCSSTFLVVTWYFSVSFPVPSDKCPGTFPVLLPYLQILSWSCFSTLLWLSVTFW